MTANDKLLEGHWINFVATSTCFIILNSLLESSSQQTQCLPPFQATRFQAHSTAPTKKQPRSNIGFLGQDKGNYPDHTLPSLPLQNTVISFQVLYVFFFKIA